MEVEKKDGRKAKKNDQSASMPVSYQEITGEDVRGKATSSHQTSRRCQAKMNKGLVERGRGRFPKKELKGKRGEDRHG